MPPQPTILVVDDQPELLSGLQLTLEAAGYRVLLAEDGHLALDRLRSETVDLILADIAMPEMNGYQLFEHVRADPRLVRIPFLFLSARALASDVRYGKSLGADDYLAKPVKPEDLLAAVEGRLRRSRELATAPAQDPPLPPVAARPVNPAPQPAAGTIVVGSLLIAPAQHRAWFGRRELQLSAREFRVLELLARRAGEVIAPRELAQAAHGVAVDEQEAGMMMRALIRQLRRRLGYDAGEMGCIENVRGVGYRLLTPEA